MLDFEKICRLCMRSNQKLTRIFDDKKYDEKPIGIAAMLNECSKYKVVRFDGLPQHICCTCVAAAKSAHRFMKDCENSYQRLMQMLNGQSNTLNDEDTKYIVTPESYCRANKETQTDDSAMHVCVRCDEKFYDIENLLLHQANEHKGSEIICRFCSKKFDRVGYLRSHIAYVHPETGYKSDSQCHICNKHFTRKDHMRRHLKDVHKVQFSTNRKPTTDKEELDYREDNNDDEDHHLSDAGDHDIKETTQANTIQPVHTVLINENCTVDNSRSHIAFNPELGYKSDSQCHICDKHFSRRDHMLRHLRDIHKVPSSINRKPKQYTKELDNHANNNDDHRHHHPSSADDHGIMETIPANTIEPMHTVLINENCKVDNLKLEDLEEEDTIGPNLNEFKHTNEKYIFNSNNREFQSSFTEEQTKGVNTKSCVTKVFTCDECDKTYDSETEYKNHRITKHKASEFDTEKQTLLNTNLKHKTLIKSQPIKIEINDSDDDKSESDYDDSMTNNDPIDEASDEDSNSLLVPDKNAKESKANNSKSQKKKLFCKQCKITFVTEKQLQKHCSAQHNEKKFECNFCDRSFNRKADLRRHLPTHNKKQFSCRECAQNFNTKHELDEHKKTDGHNKPMLCPECGLRCKSTSSLMVHMRRHTGEKPYKCKFCNKGFPRSDDLKQHEKYHTGERTHFCETCGKGFQRKYHLTTHIRVHTGEKPYKCPHCAQAFSQGHDLKVHIRRHTGERLRCELCDASFLQGYKMRQHKFIEHGIKEEAPTQRLEKFTSLEQQEQQIKEIQQLQSSEVLN